MGVQDKVVEISIADTFLQLEKESARLYPFKVAYGLVNGQKLKTGRNAIPFKKQIGDISLFFLQSEDGADKHAVRHGFIVETSNIMPYMLAFSLRRDYAAIYCKSTKKNRIVSLGKDEMFFRSDFSKRGYEQRFISLIERDMGSSDFPIYTNIVENPIEKSLSCMLECDLHSMARAPNFSLGELAKEFNDIKSEIIAIYQNPIDFGFRKIESYDNLKCDGMQNEK